MDDTLGLVKHWLQDENQKVDLAGRVDPNPPSSSDERLPYMDHHAVIVLHEAFTGERQGELRKRPFPIDRSVGVEQWPAIREDQPELTMPHAQSGRAMDRLEASYNYRDPLGEEFGYGGRWIAGFGQVGNTELMVIVKQKYEVAVGRPISIARQFVFWGGGGFVLALAFTVGAVGYRRSLLASAR
jgi:hypothetical protein